ncbi:MAG TPA: FAA hydrolase family protein [Gammaproteobacteria bacterium]|nr:FAA hydrolase family protein [Gammaproteobacteria bacterium]
MKLASLKNNSRDGALVVVSKNLLTACTVNDIAPSLIRALESWASVGEKLQQVYEDLNNQKVKNSFKLNMKKLCSPLPRSYQWLDGSAYLPHVRRVRKARNADMPESFLTDPLMYQGSSDSFSGPCDDIPLMDESWGADFESEVAIITDDIPIQTTAHQAASHIALLMLANDYSLRNLIPSELAKGFGFIHGKPSGSFSPVAVTPDELNEHWQHCKLHLPLKTWLNGELFGEPDAGTDMQFGFDQLIEHACKSRQLSAGTIIGSGTVSNADETLGASCLVEKRVIEIAQSGKAKTPYLKYGDRIKIEMLDASEQSIFGAIEQRVVQWHP